ncbi:glycosyltransferase [Nostoc sp. CENA543]|uniref:glycosyltransferase n=1 Tax=Nostoc sp. CENA543 TaxID=1869241 RepID=UPI0012FFFAD6|nr:glycosyltransferase [Nostoc sp. CENA543]
MNEQPLVSILINNYNYERFLPEAIESVLNQNYSPVEIVVVDDGSKDNSQEVIRCYGEKVISVFKKNGGQASAFNAGFSASHGEIICFLDADDYYYVDKVGHIVDIFRQYPAAGWIFHELDDLDQNGNSVERAENQCLSEFKLTNFRDDLLKGNSLCWMPATSGLCFRRNILDKILPMPENMRISADNFLRLAATYLGSGILLPEKLAVHRIHGSNLFEFRPDLEYINAETNIKTSYYLKQKFPETKPFADRLFAHSLGRMVAKDGFAKAYKITESREYINQSSWEFWLSCAPRIVYNYAKAVLT